MIQSRLHIAALPQAMQPHPFPPVSAITCNESVPGAAYLKTNQEFWTFGVEDIVYRRGEFCRLWFGKESVIWLVKTRVLLSINENDSMLRLWEHKRKYWNLLSGHESHSRDSCSLNAVLNYRIIFHGFFYQVILSSSSLKVWERDVNSTGFPPADCVIQRCLHYWCSKLMNLFSI